MVLAPCALSRPCGKVARPAPALSAAIRKVAPSERMGPRADGANFRMAVGSKGAPGAAERLEKWQRRSLIDKLTTPSLIQFGNPKMSHGPPLRPRLPYESLHHPIGGVHARAGGPALRVFPTATL